MAIPKRKQPVDKIAFGRTVKSTLVAGLNSVEEVAGIIEDTLVTARSVIELVHTSLQEPILDQRAEIALSLNANVKLLVAKGMDEAQAKKLLQYDSYVI